MIRHLGVNFLLLFLISSPTFAGDIDLFKKVTPAKADRLYKSNQHELDDELYLSKRHRYVTINRSFLKTLSSKESINLNFFEDTVVHVDHKSTKVVGSGAVAWNGSADYSAKKTSKAFNFNTRLIENENLRAAAESISLYFYSWKTDEKSGVVSSSKSLPGNSVSQTSNLDGSGDRVDFLSMMAKITIPHTRQKFFVMPVEYNPKYLVVYELDEDKMYTVNFDSDDFVESLESKRKREKHSKFLKRERKSTKKTEMMEEP